MVAWRVNAEVVAKVYGTQVDKEEEFYICPACGEPVYACDWDDEELVDVICPICGFDETEE